MRNRAQLRETLALMRLSDDPMLVGKGELCEQIAGTFISDMVGNDGSLQLEIEELFAGLAAAVVAVTPSGVSLLAAVRDLISCRENVRIAFAEHEKQRRGESPNVAT